MKSPSLPTRIWRTTQQCMKERPLVSSVEKLNPLQVTLQGSSDSKFNNQLYIWWCNINLPTSMDFHSFPCCRSRSMELWVSCQSRFISERLLWKARALPVPSVWQEIWKSEESVQPPSSTWLQDHLHNLWRSRVNKDQPESTPENNPPGNLCPVNDQKGNNINSGPFLKLPCF